MADGTNETEETAWTAPVAEGAVRERAEDVAVAAETALSWSFPILIEWRRDSRRDVSKSSVNPVGAGILPSGLPRRGNNYKLLRVEQLPALLLPPLAPGKRWFAGREGRREKDFWLSGVVVLNDRPAGTSPTVALNVVH